MGNGEWTPAPLPAICLGVQIKLSAILSDSDDITVTFNSLLDFGSTNLVTFIKDCDSYNSRTSVSKGHSSFFSFSNILGSMKPPILCYLGNPCALETSWKSACDYQVTDVRFLKANASTIDTARANNVDRGILKKTLSKSS